MSTVSPKSRMKSVEPRATVAPAHDMSLTPPVGLAASARSAGLLDLLPQPLIIVGRDDRIVASSSEAEVFFGHSAATLSRMSLADLLSSQHPIVGLIDKVRRNGASINEYGLDFSSPRTGVHPQVDVFAKATTDGDVVLLLVERTMAHMIERQLSHRTSARAVTGLAAMLAHEIKNPLSGIRGAAQLLAADVDEDGRQLTTMICVETDRIVALVNRMAAIGDSGPAATEPVNIHSVLDHVKRLAVTGFAGELTLIEDYDPSLPSLNGHQDRLIQAILNLVKNAAEAIGNEGRGDGRITLRTAFRPAMRLARPGGGGTSLPLMVAVEDNGPGIPESVRPALFEPFVTSKPSGSGLGLALVASVVAEHGGVIRVERERGHTIFRMFFPVAAERT
jgi:two-component system, NtrC family, nitrogen regulation sensor histidine kinase GlnL